MANKRYIAKTTRFSCYVQLKGGKEKFINFNEGFRGGNIDVKANYTTDNKEVQDALEKDFYFGKEYFIDDSFVDTTETKTSKKD